MMDDQDNLRGGLARSVLFHAALLGGLTLYGYLSGIVDPFGAPDAGMPAIGVNTVVEIPLPSRGPKNPVAEDTESDVPQEVAKEEPKPQPKVQEPEPDDAVSLLPPDRSKKQPLVPKSRLKTFEEIAQNQVTSKSPQAMSSPMMALKGGNQINVGGDTTLGNQFPAYAAQIKEITRSKWRVQDVDRSVTSAPLVTIQFILMKDGRATNIRIIRRSGVPTLDLSVQNAVEESVYPPLPPGFTKDSVPVEFTFELKR